MSQRKNDHINMAATSIPATLGADNRFNYEPLLNAQSAKLPPVYFLGKEMKHPLWISSMTGGSSKANRINHTLAEAAAEFGLGMGLGSCRALLDSDRYFDDFNLRPVLGDELPFYSNLGIAQVEQLLKNKEFSRMADMLEKLRADGLFVHVNPVQEFLQPEGDTFDRPVHETIAQLVDETAGAFKIMVKEVGQGMGPESLAKLMQIGVDGIEFGAFGGTNFASIEMRRNQNGYAAHLYPLSTFGHNAEEMVLSMNKLYDNHKNHVQLIISGGIKNFLDGYYLIQKSKMPAVYGMAGTVLRHAMESKTDLFDFIKAEVEGYKFASVFLTVK
ncbi:MAG: isopentenyl-diphosphate delta-isomerase [Prolixibacteraceae bacterium]|nr:isopentenyl-diphosphate delta-isomerase [Prolixibacteraceae bacterium]